MITSRNSKAGLMSGLLLSALIAAAPALAQDMRTSCLDWKKLNLTPQQSEQIKTLEQDWNTKYLRLQPQIVENQRKLSRLLENPKSDSLEIMQTQQTIARLKEQLRNDATANYLHKRALLSEAQQRQLETMLHQMVAERQRPQVPVTAPEEQSGFMGDLIHKVKWAIEGQH